jgi:hypothetical protein
VSALVAGCGGSSPTASTPTSDTGDAEARAASASLSGTVAVGAPITDGMLKVTDADGTVVVDGKSIDADGRYDGVTLSGKGPWTLEACGFAGERWLCLRSVVQAGGTGNVTPLTDAMLALAIEGAAPAAGPLRDGLAALLQDAGLPSDFDFVSGSLQAGSRTGYDRLLDAIGVAKGEDGQPFVQIVPRLGTGNLYIERGSSPQGRLAVDAAAGALPLAGLERLFRDLSASMASADACTSAATGVRRSLASTARISFGEGEAAIGADAVADALCRMFGRGEDGSTPMWGSRLVSPTLGRCDLGGAVPLCGVSFALRSPDGSVKALGSGMGVSYEGAAWKFAGDLLPISIHAAATVQRDRRVDGPTPVDRYSRALQFDIAAAQNLACARVSQRNPAGDAVTIGFYKPHGTDPVRRLSLWTEGGFSNAPSLDPATGATRSADDTWIMLPEGSDGDAVIRNFYRGGRTVRVDLYADPGCATPLALDGRSGFDVEVDGVPPVWAALPSLSWPELGATSVATLRDFALGAGEPGTLSVSWSTPRGNAGFDSVSVCSARDCGDGSAARVGERSIRPGATTAAVPIRTTDAMPAGGFRMVSLYGRAGDGMGMQANLLSCPSRPAGQTCD